jgi:hypothetical protein
MGVQTPDAVLVERTQRLASCLFCCGVNSRRAASITGSRPLLVVAHMPGGLSNGTNASSFRIAHSAQMMKPETVIMMIDQTG